MAVVHNSRATRRTRIMKASSMKSTVGQKIVIFGTGDIAQLASFYFTHDTPHEVVAYTVDAQFLTSDRHLGLPLVAFESVEEIYAVGEYELFVALSYRNVNEVRAEKFYQAKAKGYRLASYISSRLVSWIDPSGFGENCFVLENNTIQPFVSVGDNVTLWSGNHIGHHSSIGEHTFVSSHVVISGHVKVGTHCFLGVNSTVRDGITLANKTVLGADASIQKDTEAFGVYVGRPAMKSKQRSDEIDYFNDGA